MKRYPLRVLELSRKAKNTDVGRPVKFPVAYVEADTVDEARRKVQDALRTAGKVLRGLACAVDGSLSATVFSD